MMELVDYICRNFSWPWLVYSSPSSSSSSSSSPFTKQKTLNNMKTLCTYRTCVTLKPNPKTNKPKKIKKTYNDVIHIKKTLFIFYNKKAKIAHSCP